MAFGFSPLLLDHQKLEREARICRLLKHPNIGKCTSERVLYSGAFRCGGWRAEARRCFFVCGTTSAPGPSPAALPLPHGEAAVSGSELGGHSRVETWVSSCLRCHLRTGVRDRNRSHAPFLPSSSSSSCLWAEARAAQCVRFWAGVPPRGPPWSGFCFWTLLKECCPRCSAVHTLGVSMVPLFVFSEPGKQAARPPGLSGGKGGRSHVDGEGEERGGFFPAPTLTWGTRAHCWLFGKPEEVCLPRPTPLSSTLFS